MAAPIAGVGRRMFITKFIEIPDNSLYHSYDIRIHKTNAELYFPDVSTESIILALSSNLHDIWTHNCCLFTRAKFTDTSDSFSRRSDSLCNVADSASPFESLTLMCTRSFLTHYGFSTSTTLYAVRAEPFPIDTVTLGVKNPETFEWISKTEAFTTGMVVSVIQEEILVRKGDMFFPPESPLFDSASGFTASMLSDLVVLDCAPLTQGLLTVNTEIIVIRIHDDANSTTQTTGEDVSPVILSDFASCMLQFNGSFLQSHILDKEHSRKNSRDESFQQVSVVVVNNLENIVATSTRNRLPMIHQSSYDISNTIGLTKSCAVKNGLFDGSFVSIKVPDESRNLGVKNSEFQMNGCLLNHNTSARRLENSARNDKTEPSVMIRTVQVKVVRTDTCLKDDCMYMLPSLWFNLMPRNSGNASSDDSVTLLLKVWYA